MANEIAKRDENRVPVGLAVTNDANLEVKMLRVDSTTGELLTKMSSDIQIGAVEIKNGTTDQRATVDLIGSKGAIATQVVDASGNQITSFGSPSTIAEYISPVDFTVTYTSASTITLTGLPFTLSSSVSIVYIRVRNSSTNITTVYVNGSGGYAFRYSSGVVTAYKDGAVSSIFTSNDMYEMGLNGPKKFYDSSLDVAKIVNQSSDRLAYVADSLLDTTNIAAATNYYPSATGMSMDGFKGLSSSFKFIDADGTMTMSFEFTNDEDTTNADWIDGSLTAVDIKTGINVLTSALTVTNGTLTGGVLFKDINFSSVRVKMVNDGATNTGIIKIRRIY